MQSPSLPFGVKFLAGFFAFGALMCALTVVLLLFPESRLEAVWNLNPTAHAAFTAMGYWAVLLMMVVGTACASTAVGLAIRRSWSRVSAVVILTVNSLGDLANVSLRHDYRALIGLPVAGAMIAYLLSRRVRLSFPQRIAAADHE
jgi:hypothetical protein